MSKLVLIHVTFMLVYLAYRGIFCEEIATSPEAMYGNKELRLRDLINFLDGSRQDDLRYLKRSEKGEEGYLEASSEAAVSLNPEELLKNNQYLWQIFSEQIKNPPQTRFLSPRMGRNADPHGIPSLPPRFGKRTTVFTPRMG